ncbi:MAG: hypothetical protein H6581_24185 [Bacteroidia bacterium]|nr:hypothetical protein [Bacteroidia bacterium]
MKKYALPLLFLLCISWTSFSCSKEQIGSGGEVSGTINGISYQSSDHISRVINEKEPLGSCFFGTEIFLEVTPSDTHSIKIDFFHLGQMALKDLEKDKKFSNDFNTWQVLLTLRYRDDFNDIDAYANSDLISYISFSKIKTGSNKVSGSFELNMEDYANGSTVDYQILGEFNNLGYSVDSN